MSVPTVGQLLRQEPHWFWLYCDACGQGWPVGLACFVIRWGPKTSSDAIRRSARCGACGHRGAQLRHPSWGDSQRGWQSFPLPR